MTLRSILALYACFTGLLTSLAGTAGLFSCTIAETAHITLGKCTLIIYLCLCSRRVSCAYYVRTVRQS